jgi:hypothetical protein
MTISGIGAFSTIALSESGGFVAIIDSLIRGALASEHNFALLLVYFSTNNSGLPSAFSSKALTENDGSNQRLLDEMNCALRCMRQSQSIAPPPGSRISMVEKP